MIKKDYIFPYELGDSAILGAKWENDVLTITFFRYYVDDNTPNDLEIKFHGVEWIRSTTLIKYPCPDEEWESWEYIQDKPITDYLLVKREWFNNDTAEFLSGNGLGINTIRCLEDNTVFLDDLIIFSCTEIEIVRAICTKKIETAKKRLKK